MSFEGFAMLSNGGQMWLSVEVESSTEKNTLRHFINGH